MGREEFELGFSGCSIFPGVVEKGLGEGEDVFDGETGVVGEWVVRL